MKPTELERTILYHIGEIVLKRNNNDHPKTIEELHSYFIHGISYDEAKKEVTLYLERPGNLIGHRGSNIDHIIKELRIRLTIEDLIVNIKESLVLCYLLPREDHEYDYISSMEDTDNLTEDEKYYIENYPE